MDPDVAKQLRALIDAHDEMFRGLREANHQIGSANHHLLEASHRLDAIVAAHDQTIQAALQANQSALAILARLAGE